MRAAEQHGEVFQVKCVPFLLKCSTLLFTTFPPLLTVQQRPRWTNTACSRAVMMMMIVKVFVIIMRKIYIDTDML